MRDPRIQMSLNDIVRQARRANCPESFIGEVATYYKSLEMDFNASMHSIPKTSEGIGEFILEKNEYCYTNSMRFIGEYVKKNDPGTRLIQRTSGQITENL